MSISQVRSETHSHCETPEHALSAESDAGLRTCEEFEFVANAPMDRVFPLFGAEKERVWAEGWNPRFVWPVNAEDREGMIFQIAHDNRTATWVNTLFDREAGRIQYVYILPETVATVITLRLTARHDSTHVSVRYERTSLSTVANAVVRNMGDHDKLAGPEWQAQINRYLAKDSHPETR